MLKKSALLSSTSGLHYSSQTSQISTSPRSLPPPHARPQAAPYIQRRSYADVKDSDIPWPENSRQSRVPTPYEIFHLKPDDPYSKQIFYDLVKLYHPDRHGLRETHCGGISHAVKIERYRLVILAHSILSDPVKRGEYDRSGAGWVVRRNRDSPGSAVNRKRHHSPPFGFRSDDATSPFNNATWEDWERWRSRDYGSAQAHQGNYISPNGFASLIITLAVISGVAQATKSGQYSLSLEDKLTNITHETNNFMESRAEDSNELQHDGRVRLFLEKRDPTRSGLKEDEETSYRKTFSSHLTPTEKSQSEGFDAQLLRGSARLQRDDESHRYKAEQRPSSPSDRSF